MARRKLKHMQEILEFQNVYTHPSEMKGKWHSEVFKNDNPIVLEMGCAHGHYTLGLARQFPEKNYIGMDKKGGRIWNGATKAMEEELENVAFLRGLGEKLTENFDQGELDEIWVTFPDPFPKPCKENKRLISPRFLDIYRQILKEGGTVHLKTDNKNIYQYSLELVKSQNLKIIDSIEDLHNIERAENAEFDYLRDIRTFYESKFMALGSPIYYLSFSLK